MGKFLSLVTLLLAVAFAAGTASAQSLAAAKKEGKAVVYGSLESDTMEAISKAFTKKTGVEVDYWRASATKVMDRAQSEFRAGKPLFDAIATNDNPLQLMYKENLFAKYDSPSAKGFA